MGFEGLLGELLETRRGRMEESGLSLDSAVEAAPVPPPSAMAAGLAVLLDDLILRAGRSARPCSAKLASCLVETDSIGLRLILRDDLPGLSPEDRGLFAYLSGLAVDEKELSPPEGSLTSLAGKLKPLVRNFDLHSGARGTTIWLDFVPVDPPPANGDVAGEPPGWHRHPLHVPADLLRRLAGNREIAAKVLSIFLATTPELIGQLRIELDRADGAEARRLYHSIKGSAANVGGLMLSAVAKAGERAAGDGDFGAASAILPRLVWEYERFADACAE